MNDENTMVLECIGTEKLDQLTRAERSLWTAHRPVHYVDINWVEKTLTSAGMRVTRKVMTLPKSVSSEEEVPTLRLLGVTETGRKSTESSLRLAAEVGVRLAHRPTAKLFYANLGPWEVSPDWREFVQL